jgi:hypothetical protein
MPIPQFNRSVHQCGVLEQHARLLGRQQDLIEARCLEIAPAREHPELRALLHFDHNVEGRLGRPADEPVAVSPIDPSRAPLLAADPDPTVIGVEKPSSVVIGDPSPVGLLSVFHPVPSIGLGIDPMTDGIGPPILTAVGRHPDVTEVPVVVPHAIRT